jgi:hypothetical protein
MEDKSNQFIRLGILCSNPRQACESGASASHRKMDAEQSSAVQYSAVQARAEQARAGQGIVGCEREVALIADSGVQRYRGLSHYN